MHFDKSEIFLCFLNVICNVLWDKRNHSYPISDVTYVLYCTFLNIKRVFLIGISELFHQLCFV